MAGNYIDPNRLSLVPTRSNSSRTACETTPDSSESDSDDPPVSAVLESLEDDKCREILAALREPKSASRLCEECELASSTAYRKLERLRETALVREYTEVRRDGPNVTLYERDFTEIAISIDDDEEFSVAIDRPAEGPEDRMATFWSEMKNES
ncbi:winged helix-turn-helix domain-containing protein [Halorussus caseinilyticus]|uniref:Helix-turn-helix domain-containing protein n=1 Tax=Halorussus caseinilyticus TaxID=3034025 RepID=A0ABD5WP96_9EURY|nr:helix-turn-helix domain-containing protein [Halorussus sp. DT72]